MQDIFSLPERAVKPRNHGITMMIDSGLTCHQVEESLDDKSQYIDYVKLGWGTAVITTKLKEKIFLYQAAGVPVCLGGTFFEVAVLQNKVDEMAKRALQYNIEMLEVSDGSISLSAKDKCAYIKKLSKQFRVVSEVGSKDSATIMAPRLWVESMKAELEAGSWKVIAEGRESGSAGLYRDSNELRTGLVDEIALDIPNEEVIWEAPLTSQQSWFIHQFGSDVNLGNIPASGVVGLETLRLGLRGDTVGLFFGAGSVS